MLDAQVLLFFSINTGAEKATHSIIGMLQFYYGGNYAPLYTKIAGGKTAPRPDGCL